MDKCKRCGKSLGIFSGLFSEYCESCKNIIGQEKISEQVRLEKEKSEKQRQQFEQFNRYKANLAKSKMELVKKRIDNGEILYLYQNVYLPVDSVVVEERIIEDFSIAKLRSFGFDGWDIVGIVPRTFGVGLTNSSYGSSMGTTWGAGVGGNIIGVHVLLKKEISAAHRVSDILLEEYIEENISEFVTEAEQQTLLEILSGTITLTPELETSENITHHSTIETEPKTEPRQKNYPANICSKCHVLMHVKVAKSGEKQGQSFYVCPNYSQCKQAYPIEG